MKSLIIITVLMCGGVPEGTDMTKYYICYIGGFHGWCEK